MKMETTKSLQAKEIKQKIQNNEDIVLVDALSKESFCAKHIPGSINIPVANIREYAEIILPDKNQNIVVYCKNADCKKSDYALETFVSMGYKNVIHYPDGLEGWQKEGFELVVSGPGVKDEC